MRDNWKIALKGARVLLVPYRKRHVAKYHNWMQDPAIQEATASEPLSLPEEYAMQADWRDDPKKCTFIVLAADDGDAAAATDSATAAAAAAAAAAAESDLHSAAHAEGGADAAQCGDHCDEARMIGDVNLFFGADHDDPAAAEVEVMIAEAAYRRRGYAREAVAMLMRYGVESLGVSRYFCKIGEDNVGSLRLFETLGFERCNYAPAFQEVELQFCPGKHPMPAAPMAVVDAPDLHMLTAEDNGQQSL